MTTSAGEAGSYVLLLFYWLSPLLGVAPYKDHARGCNIQIVFACPDSPR